MPGEPEKKSIINPMAKDKRSKSHDGISIGKRRMNIIYTYGLTYPLNWILLKSNTWSRISKIKIRPNLRTELII
jgi:hypothetical protein